MYFSQKVKYDNLLSSLALFHGLFDNKLGQVRLVRAVGQNEVRPSDKPSTNDLGYLLSNSFHGINRSYLPLKSFLRRFKDFCVYFYTLSPKIAYTASQGLIWAISIFRQQKKRPYSLKIPFLENKGSLQPIAEGSPTPDIKICPLSYPFPVALRK